MKLIQDMFPSFNILYNSPFFPYSRYNFSLKYLLRKESEENVIKENTFFIINVSDHWVLLTNFGCDSSTWHVYDSLYNPIYVFNLDKIFHHFETLDQKNDVFFVTHRDIVRQSGTTDCGLFALGILYSLCDGKNPSLIHLNRKECVCTIKIAWKIKNLFNFHTQNLLIKLRLTIIYIFTIVN